MEQASAPASIRTARVLLIGFIKGMSSIKAWTTWFLLVPSYRLGMTVSTNSTASSVTSQVFSGFSGRGIIISQRSATLLEGIIYGDGFRQIGAPDGAHRNRDFPNALRR